MGLNCICETMAGRAAAKFAPGRYGGTSVGLTAEATCYASQRAAQSPVEIRVKCPDDGAWIISPPSIQQAFADEHVDFRFA
jgi:hypothetical protein